jgi:hypothetical protein
MNEQEIADVREQLKPDRRERARDITVTIAPADLLALDAAAGAEGKTRSWMIREAVRRVWTKRPRKKAKTARELPRAPELENLNQERIINREQSS